MTTADGRPQPTSARRPVVIRLPGFVTDQEIGAGDALKRLSYRVGIRPCGGCANRAQALDQRLRFAPGRSSKGGG